MLTHIVVYWLVICIINYIEFLLIREFWTVKIIGSHIKECYLCLLQGASVLPVSLFTQLLIVWNLSRYSKNIQILSTKFLVSHWKFNRTENSIGFKESRWIPWIPHIKVLTSWHSLNLKLLKLLILDLIGQLSLRYLFLLLWYMYKVNHYFGEVSLV